MKTLNGVQLFFPRDERQMYVLLTYSHLSFVLHNEHPQSLRKSIGMEMVDFWHT